MGACVDIASWNGPWAFLTGQERTCLPTHNNSSRQQTEFSGAAFAKPSSVVRCDLPSDKRHGRPAAGNATPRISIPPRRPFFVLDAALTVFFLPRDATHHIAGIAPFPSTPPPAPRCPRSFGASRMSPRATPASRSKCAKVGSLARWGRAWRRVGTADITAAWEELLADCAGMQRQATTHGARRGRR